MLKPRTLGFAAIALLTAGWAHAQYPEKPIRIVVPFVAGGVSDNVAVAMVDTACQ